MELSDISSHQHLIWFSLHHSWHQIIAWKIAPCKTVRGAVLHLSCRTKLWLATDDCLEESCLCISLFFPHTEQRHGIQRHTISQWSVRQSKLNVFIFDFTSVNSVNQADTLIEVQPAQRHSPWCPIVHDCSQCDKTRQLYTAIRYQQSANWHISFPICKDTAIRYTAIYSYQISAIYHTFTLKQFSFNTFSLFAELENDPVWMRHTLISSGQGQEWFSANIALENLPFINEFPSYKPGYL